MTARLVRLSALTLAAVLPLATRDAAAQAARRPVASVTPYVGYMMFGKYLQGPLGTNVTNENAPLYGAQLSLAMSPTVSLVGNVAYASSDLRIGVPIIGGVSVGSGNVLLYDAAVQLALPQGASPVVPFIQGGAGAIRYDLSNRLINATATNLAFNVGAGIDYQLSPTLGVRAMVKDYIGNFDFKDATSLDFKGRTANNIALSLGLKLGF